MKKIFALLAIICFGIGGNPTTETKYQFIVKHIFDDVEIVTKDEYAIAGTQYTIQPLLNQEIEGYDDGIWEVAYTSIDGGNSQIEETYDNVIIWPTRATTITLIHDNTTIEYHYVFSKNVHVIYTWENSPNSAVLPMDDHGYKDGAYTKETIIIDESYKAGDVVEEGNYIYTFSGWTKNKKNNKIIIVSGSWEKVEKEPVITQPEETPEPPDTGI